MILRTAETDLSRGATVLVGDHYWRHGPMRPAAMAFFFGLREQFEHLGMICTVAWWRGKPYLVRIREARA